MKIIHRQDRSKQYSQYTHNLAVRLFRATIVRVENQEVLDIMSV